VKWHCSSIDEVCNLHGAFVARAAYLLYLHPSFLQNIYVNVIACRFLKILS